MIYTFRFSIVNYNEIERWMINNEECINYTQNFMMEFRAQYKE